MNPVQIKTLNKVIWERSIPCWINSQICQHESRNYETHSHKIDSYPIQFTGAIAPQVPRHNRCWWWWGGEANYVQRQRGLASHQDRGYVTLQNRGPAAGN